MNNELSLLKGIHPGIVLARKLKERNLAKGAFALSIMEYPQTLCATTKGKRNMNTPLPLKIEAVLGLPEGYFMTFQIFYEIKEEKARQVSTPTDFSRLRSGLFWDTDINLIDWNRQTKAVIERVFERGNEQEMNEIKRFYGDEVVNEILKKTD